MIYSRFSILIIAIASLWVSTASLAGDIFTANDYKARRAALAEKISNDEMLVVFASEHKIYSEDVNYPYHPDVTLRYLTGATQEDTIYVLRKSNDVVTEYLFTKAPNLLHEKWVGKIASVESIKNITGLSNVYKNDGSDGVTFAEIATMDGIKTLWLERGNDPKREDFSPAQRFANDLRETHPNLEIKTFRPLTQKMREIKSANEILALRKAIDISVAGHVAAMRRALTADYEYQIEAAMEQVFADMGAESEGYPSIVGAGRNSTILHYETNREAVPEGSLVLIDAAAEYQGYSADITRTFPVDGTFSDAQKDIYQIVYDAQEAAFALSKPGANFRDMTIASFDVIAEGLLKLGLITQKTPNQIRLYAYHGLGHGIGLNVHDPNPYGNLQPGAVYTIEPGVYVNKNFVLNDPAFLALDPQDQAKIKQALDKYDTIGVRIEDDLLITKDGYENLSVAAPRSIKDIEAWMAKK